MFILEMTKRILRNLHLHLQAYCRLICAVLSLHFSSIVMSFSKLKLGIECNPES